MLWQMEPGTGRAAGDTTGGDAIPFLSPLSQNKFDMRQVEPGTALDYAWDEPQATRRLRCLLEGAGGAFRDSAVHSYSLDEIRVGAY